MTTHLKRRGQRWLCSTVAAAALFQSAACYAQGATASPAASGDTIGTDEIVVTATRSAEILSKVPISITAFTQEKLDKQGIRGFTDVVRFTPALALSESRTGGNNISIRGISSSAGASTTGIYIDDVPIQIRQIGISAANIFPAVFDLERIEVLRGPQGTLFGAGSEGGTVRFIQPSPSTNDWSVYARAEGSVTPHAEGSYEGGIAVGGPIVQDKLGFRVSAYYRKEGGYIDSVPAIQGVVPGGEQGQLGPASATFQQSGPGDKNFNDTKTLALRGALAFTPTETVTITPSIFYQEGKTGAANNAFTLSGSRPEDGYFVTAKYTAGEPSEAAGITALSLPDTQKGKQKLLVATLNVDAELDFATLHSTSSYVRQKIAQYSDLTEGYERIYFGEVFASPGAKGISLAEDGQKSYTQEIRLQSSDPDARLRWVVGGYFNKSTQTSDQLIEENKFFYADSFFGIPNLDNGDPFGPGFNNTQNIWGAPMIGASGTYQANARSVDKQLAGFGQLDFRVTDQITLIAGARYSKNWLDYSLSTAGPENNLNAPFGSPCPTGPTCTFGSGVFAPIYPTGSVRNVETSFTPKVGVNFQVDPRNLFYVSASKGFRPGGGQLPLPSGCGAELTGYGYVDANGNPTTPATYDSDSVWSYEVGSKNRLFGNLLTVAASAYTVKWKGIQTNLFLPTCGYFLVDNLSSATVKGFDLSVDIRPTDSLFLNATVAYTHTALDKSLISPGGAVILAKGGAINRAGPPWRVVLTGQYDVALPGNKKGYVRADMTYSSRAAAAGPTDPNGSTYDPFLQRDEGYTVVNARVGMTSGPWDISVFATNLFDEAPLLNNFHSTILYTATTIRPRTIGVTATFRK